MLFSVCVFIFDCVCPYSDKTGANVSIIASRRTFLISRLRPIHLPNRRHQTHDDVAQVCLFCSSAATETGVELPTGLILHAPVLNTMKFSSPRLSGTRRPD